MSATTTTPATIEILDPRSGAVDDAASLTYDLVRPLQGAKVGLRLDHSWRSYYTVVDVWEQRLRRDGAEPVVLWTGERVGGEGVTTRADLDEWSRLVDCGVVGLGN
jgi:hypothetical protein